MLIGSRTVKTHYQMQGENLAMREVSDAAAGAKSKKKIYQEKHRHDLFPFFVFSFFVS